MARTKKKARKGLKDNLSVLSQPTSSMQVPIPEKYNCSKEARKLIKQLNRTCQSQALLIKSLEDDKRNLFMKAAKAGQQLEERKALLKRLALEDPNSDDIEFNLWKSDALRVFSILGEADEDDPINDDEMNDDKTNEMAEMTDSLDGVNLDGEAPGDAENAVGEGRKRRKLEKRKQQREEAAQQLQEELTRTVDEAAANSSCLERETPPGQAASEAMTVDMSDPFWQGM